jgi:hypothetical protein
MEDNIYQLSMAWQQLDESWNRLDEKKANKPTIPGSGHIGKQGKAGAHDNKKWAAHKGHKDPKHKGKEVELEEDGGAACGATVAPGGAAKTASAFIKQGGVPSKLGAGNKKNLKENFDIASLAGPQAAEVEPEIGETEGIEPEAESPAVSDIIAAIQARYPGAIIEISVTAPEGHHFSDSDVSCAVEVANSSEEPEELGGAWEKENNEEGTKPINEGYPASFGKSEDDGEDSEGEEQEESPEHEDTETHEEETSEHEGDDDSGEEGGEFESAAGITKDCITLAPEAWSAFLVKVDSQPVEGEESIEGTEGEEDADIDESNKGGVPPKMPGVR